MTILGEPGRKEETQARSLRIGDDARRLGR